MNTDTPRRLCLFLGSLALLIAVGFGDRMPDFFCGLLEGLALMLAFLVTDRPAEKAAPQRQRR